MRLRLVPTASAALVALTAVSCAFVLDFPDDVRGVGGGGGSAGGGGGAGGCRSAPLAEAVLFQPESSSEGTFIGGLARNAGQTFIHGNFGGQLVGYPSQFPPNVSTITFMAKLADGGTKPEILGSASTCQPTCGGTMATFGITMMGEHPVGAGFVPSLSTSSTTCDPQFLVGSEVHFDVAGPGSACGVGNGFQPLSDPEVTGSSRIPYIARYRGVEAPDVRFSDGAQAQPVDIATAGQDIILLGLDYGAVWGWDFGNEFEYRYHLVRFDAATFSPMDVEFIEGWPDVTHFEMGGAEVPGAVTVDDQGTVWATGAHCDPGTSMCLDGRSFFLTRWGSGGITQAIPAAADNESSFGSAIASSGDRLIIGGGYNAPIVNTSLPATTDYDPFVIAVSRDDPGTTLWSWPSPGSKLDRNKYEAVFDLAVVDPAGCGSSGVVYVVGCSIGANATVKSCQRAYGDVDKGSFLVKLDLATGEELAVSSFGPTNPASEMFLPTALAADTTGIYVAFNLLGSAEVPGLDAPLTGAAPNVEGKLIRFAP